MAYFKIPKRMTPDTLAEEAFALLAVAMFRSKEQTGSHAEAVMLADTFMTCLSGTLMDFRRNLAKEPKRA